MRRVSVVGKVSGVAILVACLVGGSAVAANARSSYTEPDGVNIRSSSTTNSSINGVGYRGQQVTEHWDVRGQTITEYSSVYGWHTDNRWTYHTNQATGVSGYSWIYFIAS